MKKKVVLFLVGTSLLTSANAQEERIDYAIISKIKDEGFNHSQVIETLFNLTDVCGPRLTGSLGLKNAQEWSCKQLKDWGMENSILEPWGKFGNGWEIQKAYLAMTVPYYQQLIAVPKAWTPGTNGLISDTAILVKIESEKDFEKYKGKLKGKVVVLSGNSEIKNDSKPGNMRYTDEDLNNLYMDKNVAEDTTYKTPEQIMQTRNKARQFRQKLNDFFIEENTALVISCSQPAAYGLLFTSNGAPYATDAKPWVPEMEMGSENINRLIRLLEANKNVVIEAEIKTMFNKTDTVQYNVIAEIPGTDKNLKSEIVMIGAHMDSWHSATGATDNAAGCVVMMEVMRILTAIDFKPRRTIRIALWSAEEQGLIGSRNYVKNHFADPETMELKPEHEKLSAYYNLDNGGGKIRGIYLQGNDALRPLFEAWFQPFKDMGATTVTLRNTGSTDHIAFDNVGLPGFQFIQDPLDYSSKTHHTNMDTYDHVQKNDLMQASVIIASVVYHTAMRNDKLVRKPLPKAKVKATPANSKM